MSTLKYTAEHAWLRRESDGSVTIGITDYAQEQLGDVVYVELPEVGSRVERSTNVVVIESVKAVGEIRLPAAGSVTAINLRLRDEPELLNRAPLGDGWLLAAMLDDGDALAGLMDEAAYRSFIANLQGAR